MTYIRRAILALALIAGIGPAFAQAPPPIPALPDTERRTSYALTASNCACAVNFALYGDSTDYQNWVTVFVNGAPVAYNDATYGWTITSPTGALSSIPRPVTDGVLTFNSVQTATVQIVGARRPRRPSQFSENRGVSARDLNQVITDLTAQNREEWDLRARLLQAPAGESLTLLPTLANRVNGFLFFDGLGNPQVFPISAISTGVISLNSATGAVTLVAGSGITSIIRVGSVITITGQTTVAGPGIAVATAGGVNTVSALGRWRTVNVKADNNAGAPSVIMDVSADYVVFYRPSDGSTRTVAGAALTTSCTIGSAGPNGRDQSGAFSGGQVLWLYYISGTSGTSCVWSATAPTSGGPSFSLLSGYDSFSPAFPIALVATATLQPLLPQGGSTSYRIRDNRVWFVNSPLFEVTSPGVFVSTTDISAWCPRPGALIANIELDAELFSSAGPSQYGFITSVIPAAGNNVANLSVYLAVTNKTVANNMTQDFPLDDAGHIYSQWNIITGTATGLVSVFLLFNYSFNNGG
jgi:hypothetical protein